MLIRLRGIDRDGESRTITFEYLAARTLAQELLSCDWRWAVLESGNRIVGEIGLLVPGQHRTWWAEEEKEEEKQ